MFVGNDCCARLKRAATLSFFAPVCDFFSFLLLWPQSKACKIEWNGELFFFPIVRSLDRETRGTRTTLLHTPRFFSLLFQVKKGQGEGLQQRKESLLNQCHDIFFLFFSFLSSLNSQRSFFFSSLIGEQGTYVCSLYCLRFTSSEHTQLVAYYCLEEN